MGEREEPVEETKTESNDSQTESDSGEPTEVVDEGTVGEAEEGEVVEAEVVELDPHAQLKAELEAAQARLRTVSKAYKDLQKEMTSFRERMEARSKTVAEQQSFKAVGAVLEPVQNLKRSLTMGGDGDELKKGVEMVHQQFMTALEKLGLKEVAGEGADFDPVLHEALAAMPVTDAEQDGKVIQVHRTGYVVNGKVLQAAQVVIGKHQAPEAEA